MRLIDVCTSWRALECQRDSPAAAQGDALGRQALYLAADAIHGGMSRNQTTPAASPATTVVAVTATAR
jgi:hypothetical protein